MATVAVVSSVPDVSSATHEIPSPMLLNVYSSAAVFKKHGTMYVSEKYDGWRTYYRAGKFYTRNGNILTLPTEFYSELEKYAAFGLDFDGELWLGYGSTSSDIASFDPARIQFKIFDVPGAGATFEERLGVLKDLCFACDRISTVSHTACASEAEMNAVYDSVIVRGGEGIVLRAPTQAYVHGLRDAEFLKKKPVETVEATVTGYYQTGTVEAEGYVSSLIVQSLDGKNLAFKVSIKTTSPPPIGSIVTVRYSQYTSTGLPKFPVLVGIRAAADMPADVSLAAAVAIATKPAKKSSAPTSFAAETMEWRLTHPCCEGIFEFRGEKKGLENGHHCYYDNGRGAYYKITRAKTGDVYYCSCDAWKWQALPPQFRTCKHCIMIGNYKPVVPPEVRARCLMKKAERLLAKASTAGPTTGLTR